MKHFFLSASFCALALSWGAAAYADDYITPPYSVSDFATVIDDYTIIDVNGDGKTWSALSPYARCQASAFNASDDWLISPPIYLEAGYAYSVTFYAYTGGASWGTTNTFEVVLGEENTDEGMTNTLLVSNTLAGAGAPDEVQVYAIPDSTGLYYLGIHNISAKDQYYFYIYGLAVSAAITSAAPGPVTDLALLPKASGEPITSVIFTAPKVDYTGNVLASLTSIEVYRGEELIETLVEPKVGGIYELTDTVETAGYYTYNVIAYNDDGASETASVTGYVGLNVPGVVTSFKALDTDTPGEVQLVWTAPDEDITGLTLTDEMLTYTIKEYKGSTHTTIAEGISGTSYTYTACDASAEQTFFEWVITPATSAGEGEQTWTEIYPFGALIELPYNESFANAGYTYPMEQVTLEGTGYWNLYDDTAVSSVQSVDGDNGYAVMTGPSLYDCAALITPKMTVTGDSPGFSFYLYALGSGASDTYVIRANTDGEYSQIKYITVADIADEAGWYYANVSLADYIGKTVFFRIESRSWTYTNHPTDNIYVGDLPTNSLGITGISAPTEVDANEAFDVTVTLKNYGMNAASGYYVELYRGDEAVDIAYGDDISVGGSTTITLSDELNVASDATVTYYAVLTFEDDADSDDNTSASVEVTVIFPDFPTVTDLAAVSSSDGAVLTWTAPDLEALGNSSVTDDFEDYEAWTTDAGDWTFYDGDGAQISGFRGVTFPNIATYSTQSFWVFSASWAAYNTSYGGWTAYSGTQYLAAMFRYDLGTVDDWAISPRLTGEAQTVSLYAKSYYSSYPESIKVLYSTGSNDPSEFVEIDDAVYENISDSWTKYTADLPEGAQYFAIVSFATGAGMLMVDYVTYVGRGVADYEILGYNVYRDGTLLNDDVVTTTSYVDATYSEGEATEYYVSVVYDRGESGVSNPATLGDTGIESVDATADFKVYGSNGVIAIKGTAQSVSIHTVDGKTLFSGAVDGTLALPVARGIYLVRTAEGTKKIAVK